MGPYHDFFVLRRTEHDWKDYSRFYRDPSAIRISDYLLAYMIDTLRWIPTVNAATGGAGQGLCWHGPTVIQGEGAVIANHILSVWADLFSAGPPQLELTGPYEWIEGEGRGAGQYMTLSVSRDETVGLIRKVAAYAASAASDESLYVLHLGI